MCITVALAALSAVTQVAAGSMQQARAAQAQASYNAQVARNNATISEQNAQDVEDRGRVAQSEVRTRTRQTIGAARAGLSGSGLLMDGAAETTSGQLIGDLAAAGSMDVLTLTSNIEREAQRARVQGSQFEAQAGLLDLQGSSINPALAGVTAGISSLTKTSDILFPAARRNINSKLTG